MTYGGDLGILKSQCWWLSRNVYFRLPNHKFLTYPKSVWKLLWLDGWLNTDFWLSSLIFNSASPVRSLIAIIHKTIVQTDSQFSCGRFCQLFVGLNFLFSLIEPKGFVSQILRHYLTKEGRVRKLFNCLILIKEPYVRKSEGLTRWKILGILQIVVFMITTLWSLLC